MKKRIVLLWCQLLLASVAAVYAAPREDFARDPVKDEGRPELRAQHRVELLDLKLSLTASQKHEIEAIYTEEISEIMTLGAAPSRDAQGKISLAASERIRPLLTPEQRQKFNLIPMGSGGGLLGKSPWEQLERLDTLVHLSTDQKNSALKVYVIGTEALMENQLPENAAAVRKIRTAMSEDINRILTPAQREIWEAEPAKKGGGQPTFSAEHQVERLDAIVHFSPSERGAALLIYQEAIALLMKYPFSERPLLMPKYRSEAEEKIRTILTPDQQKAWDNERGKQNPGVPTPAVSCS